MQAEYCLTAALQLLPPEWSRKKKKLRARINLHKGMFQMEKLEYLTELYFEQH